MKRIEEHRQKCLNGMREKPKLENNDDNEEDNDVEYFREEVGEEPDEGKWHEETHGALCY